MNKPTKKYDSASTHDPIALNSLSRSSFVSEVGATVAVEPLATTLTLRSLTSSAANSCSTAWYPYATELEYRRAFFQFERAHLEGAANPDQLNERELNWYKEVLVAVFHRAPEFMKRAA